MTKVTEALLPITALLEEKKRVIGELREKGKVVFKEALSAFFEEHPKVVAISWTQYTPYFNDGDACYFSVGEPSYLVEGMKYGEEGFDELCSGELADMWNNYGEEIQYYVDKDEDNEFGPDVKEAYAESKKDFDAVATFINRNEDLMEHLFGDHVRVECTTKGIEVEEHEHD